MKWVMVGILVFLFGAVNFVFAQSEVVYQVDGMDKVTVENIAYRTVEDATLTMDIYYPPSVDQTEALPVVILINGFRDSRMSQLMGTALKDSSIQTSWGRLLAASGLIAIAYESEYPDDLEVLITTIREQGPSLGLDGEHIGLFATSSNPPVAISYANQEDRDYIRVAVYYYGSMTTPDGQFTSAIDRECQQYGCYGPSEVPELEAFRRNLPTLVVRAGLDNGENPLIEHFVAQATASEVPLTFINFPAGRHGFDFTATQSTRDQSEEIIAFTIAYLRGHLMD